MIVGREASRNAIAGLKVGVNAEGWIVERSSCENGPAEAPGPGGLSLALEGLGLSSSLNERNSPLETWHNETELSSLQRKLVIV